MAGAQGSWSIDTTRIGPKAMPSVMEPISAPFDVSGISKVSFNQRREVVSMSHKGLSTKRIQAAINRMSAKGGGFVVIPEGKWISGRIELKSGVCLHLMKGAELSFSGEIKDYLPAVRTRIEGIELMSAGAMIYADGAENIGVTGEGHIIGPDIDCELYTTAEQFRTIENCIDIDAPVESRLCDGQEGRPFQMPMFIALERCRSVLIEGITLKKSIFWNIVPQFCDNVVIRGVTIRSFGHGRTDGIDIESTTNALIEYCSLDCGDDCYTFKAGRGMDGLRANAPTERVVIRYCESLRGVGGVVFGTETAAGINDVYIHDCFFNGTNQGFLFKTRRPRGGGASRITAERILIRNTRYSAFGCDMLGSHKWVGELADRYPAREINILTPRFGDISFKDIRVENSAEFISFRGLPEMPITNIIFEGTTVDCNKFISLTDVDGLSIKNSNIKVKDAEITMDGCNNIVFDKTTITKQ